MMKKKNNKKISYSRVLLGPDSAAPESEAFETIRTNLLYASAQVDCPVFAVTSSSAHSGKSVVLANLALSFARLGKKVLLIDMDLRSPVQNKIFRVQNTCGIGDLLAGTERSFARALTRTAYEDLYLMPAGRIPPSPAELLADGRLGRVLEQAGQWFDYIFVDLPAVGVVADALIVAEQMTGYVYVVRAEHDDKTALRECLSKMKASRAKVLGIVLNDVSPEAEKKYGKADPRKENSER